jgi:hypothetical protein
MDQICFKSGGISLTPPQVHVHLPVFSHTLCHSCSLQELLGFSQLINGIAFTSVVQLMMMTKGAHSRGNLSGNVLTGHIVDFTTYNINHLYKTPSTFGSILQTREIEHTLISLLFPSFYFWTLIIFYLCYSSLISFILSVSGTL